MTIIESSWIDDELRILHDSALRFTQAEFEPHREAWEKQGMCDRGAWRTTGEARSQAPEPSASCIRQVAPAANRNATPA